MRVMTSRKDRQKKEEKANRENTEIRKSDVNISYANVKHWKYTAERNAMFNDQLQMLHWPLFLQMITMIRTIIVMTTASPHISAAVTTVWENIPPLGLLVAEVEPTNNICCVKGKKGSPYSITERRVPELIPVFGSQPAGDVSHKPGCHYFRQARSYPRHP